MTLDQSIKRILQIIDVSDRLLYDEVKAECKFQTMISATVSHELRNPLNSLICNLQYMNHNLKSMKQGMSMIQPESQPSQESLKDSKELLQNSYEGIKTSGRYITNSAQLIDFFVHDMLDYTILTSKKENFTKNIETFDIKESIEQIIGIMKDKADMKKIEIKT